MTAAKNLRVLLRTEEHSDGLDRRQMSALSGLKYQQVCAAIRSMPDVYIDRWVVDRPPPARRFSSTAVFCIVTPPPNCPRPRPFG
jgi:hypothetical protein